METFKIAVSHKMDDFQVIGDKIKVPEELFWIIFNDKIAEITKGTFEKDFDDVFNKAKGYLTGNKGKGISIGNIWFQLTTKK